MNKLVCSKCKKEMGIAVSTLFPFTKVFCSECSQKMEKWPKEVKAFVHGSKECMRELGEQAGLTGEALNQFSYALGELVVCLSINEDGSYKIVNVEE